MMIGKEFFGRVDATLLDELLAVERA
jgi:hypothetical protein